MNTFSGSTEASAPRHKAVVIAVVVAVVVAVIGLGSALWWARRANTPGTPDAISSIACALPPVSTRSGGPANMVWVPGGSFAPGDSVYPEEKPGRSVQVAGFWMDRTEVSNAQFARFVAATGYVTVAERTPDTSHLAGAPAEMRQPGAVVFVVPRQLQGPPDPLQWWRYMPGAHWRQPGGPSTHIQGRSNLPVVAIALEDAQAYARWLGHQLPTEAQWEWAAREARDQAPPQHEQPRQANTWQGRFPMEDTASDGFAGVSPVGCYAPNALGLHDMIGNVWEWTRDAWRPGHADAPPPALPTASIRTTAAPPAQGVIKGGSFLCSPDWCMRYRAGARQPQDLDLATSHLGFRTILETP